MKRTLRPVLAALTLAAAVLAVVPAAATAENTDPPWVRHVKNWPGGISNGVRAHLDPQLAKAQASYNGQTSAAPAAVGTPLQNVQMNDDSHPPLPQNETSVAYNLNNPLVAVAASNDYVSNGLAIYRTSDGGQHWTTLRQTPQFFPFREMCTGGDPSVEYSIRDRAFYLTTLCFFRTQPQSELQLWKSVDNGLTWTPSRLASVVVSNYDSSTGETDPSVFYDKELIAIDNNPDSPFYGRIYVTYVKFHMDVNDPLGRSDYCPAQVAYTDKVPHKNPQLAVWHRTPIVPDPKSGFGPKGATANQWAIPQVGPNGDLNVAYALEDCNSGHDRHLMFQKSKDGGASFLRQPVRIDKAGQFEDNPNPADLLEPTAFRAPISLTLDANKATGTLTVMYQNNVNREVSDADISVQVSRDGGFHWSDAEFVSVRAGGAPARNDQFFPWVDSDEDGNIFAIWFDRRRDPDNRWIDTWQAESNDDGRTWTSNRISTESWNPDEAFFAAGNFIGDYNGLAASNQVVYPVWTDARDNPMEQTGIGESDIWTNVEIRVNGTA